MDDLKNEYIIHARTVDILNGQWQSLKQQIVNFFRSKYFKKKCSKKLSSYVLRYIQHIQKYSNKSLFLLQTS